MYNKEKQKACKQRYFDKIYNEAQEIECACGCGTLIKNKDKYGRDKKYANGHSSRRKYDDSTQHKREWNYRNREKRQIFKKKFGQRRKSKLVKELGGKCKKCGLKYNGKNACIFDLHHEGEKKYPLNQATLINKKWDIILEEAVKCKLLCSNCHRLKHSGEY